MVQYAYQKQETHSEMEEVGMKLKRVLSYLLCAACCSVLLAGCSGTQGESEGDPTAGAATGTEGETNEENVVSNLNQEGFPIVNETITLTAYGQRDQNQAPWDEMFVFQEYEKMSNIHMDFQEVPADGFAENKQLVFASNELPDVFLRAAITANEISTYGVGSGQLMVLDDLIEEYAPNISQIFEEYPNNKQACTASDGHIYTLPTVDISATGKMDFKQWINTKWLDEMGLEIPTTLEEFRDVLIAFRDQDPNGNGEQDEIPLGLRDPNTVYQIGGAFGLGYQMRDTYNIDENGTVHNWLCDDEFKDYLIYLNDLYEEKLIWQDYYKNDRAAWRSNLAAELYGAMYMPYSDVFLNCEQDYSGYEPLIGPTGEKYWSDATSGATIGAYALSSTCSNPEAAIRWVDYFYGEEGSVFFTFGEEGTHYYRDEDGNLRFNDDILNAEEGFMTALGKITMVPGLGYPSILTDETDRVVASDRTKEAAKILEPYLPETFYAKPSVNPEDMDRVVAIEQDLTTYRDEAVTKFIIGEWDFDMWEEYCQTLEQIGIRELEDIYQRALDAQKS